jgi:hypothetical protein
MQIHHLRVVQSTPGWRIVRAMSHQAWPARGLWLAGLPQDRFLVIFNRLTPPSRLVARPIYLAGGFPGAISNSLSCKEMAA